MAHVTFQNIDELRQFVDARPANEPAYRGDPIVIPRRRTVPVGIRLRHRAELVDVEELVPATHASLQEEDFAAVVQLDHQGHEQHEGREHD